MCLYKGDNKHKIAQKDIVCYKLFERSKYRCATYYQGCSIYVGIPIVSSRVVAPEEMDKQSFLSDEVVHAFQSDDLNEYFIEEVKSITRFNNKYASSELTKDVALMKCIIPKGTIYYENIVDGTSGLCNAEPQYGATEIIPVEVVKYYTHFVKEYK